MNEVQAEALPTIDEEVLPAEYCTPFGDSCLTEPEMRKALERYWAWCEEYEKRPQFQQDTPIETLKDNPEVVAHVLMRAEIMGFKRRDDAKKKGRFPAQVQAAEE